MDQNVILNLNTDDYLIQFPLHTRFIQSYTSNTRRPSLETTSTHNLLQLNWSTNSTSKTIWLPSLFTIFIWITLPKNNSIQLVQFMSSIIKQQDHVWKTMGGSRMRAWTAHRLPLMAINHAKSWQKITFFHMKPNSWTCYTAVFQPPTGTKYISYNIYIFANLELVLNKNLLFLGHISTENTQ